MSPSFCDFACSDGNPWSQEEYDYEDYEEEDEEDEKDEKK